MISQRIICGITFNFCEPPSILTVNHTGKHYVCPLCIYCCIYLLFRLFHVVVVGCRVITNEQSIRALLKRSCAILSAVYYEQQEMQSTLYCCCTYHLQRFCNSHAYRRVQQDSHIIWSCWEFGKRPGKKELLLYSYIAMRRQHVELRNTERVDVLPVTLWSMQSTVGLYVSLTAVTTQLRICYFVVLVFVRT